MDALEPRRGRSHDAAGAREAILNAAETIFAEHGFAGARIDAIAKASSYNSSLIFHYFGDKLGLYAEVVKRADDQMTALMARVLTPLLENKDIARNAPAFKAFLEMLVTLFFDYLIEHPRFMHMLLWEQAQGWQTYSRIFSELEPENSNQFDALFRTAHSAGLLRSDFAPVIQLAMILQICLSYLTFIPLFEMALHPSADLHSPTALAHAREYLVPFVVHGMMIDPLDAGRQER